MTIPTAPLPEFGSLVRSIGAPDFTGEKWTLDRGDSIARVYSRGSYALADGIGAAAAASGKKKVTVWLPGYICNSALTPLRRLSVSIRFYSIREDLSPDWSDLELQVSSEVGLQVLILVHYFGFPNDSVAARRFCDQHGMILVDDAAHTLVPSGSFCGGDMQIFSPRKQLAVPAGGLLILPKKWLAHIPDGRCGYRYGGTVSWLGKRVAQKILMGLHIPWHPLRRNDQDRSDFEKPDEEFYADRWECDPFALKLLSVMTDRSHEIAERRVNLYRMFQKAIEGILGVQAFFSIFPEDVCPYAFPLFASNGCKEAVAHLRSAGMPVSMWPDLPPEVEGNEENFRVSNHLHNHVMLFWIHQSLTSRHIGKMEEQVSKIFSGMI